MIKLEVCWEYIHVNILVFPSEAFKYSIEVVWLAYAIVAHIYASVLTSSNIKFTMKNNGNFGECAADLIFSFKG